MPARNDRAAPPPPVDGYDVRFLRKDAALGWEDLCRQAPGPMREAYEVLSTRPCDPVNFERQHPLRGKTLGSVQVEGAMLEQWQYEVTGAPRIWYAVNSSKMKVWVSHAGAAHPKATD